MQNMTAYMLCFLLLGTLKLCLRLCDEIQFTSHLFLKLSQTFPSRDDNTLCGFIEFSKYLFLKAALSRYNLHKIKFTQFLVVTNVCIPLTTSTVMTWNISVTAENFLMFPLAPSFQILLSIPMVLSFLEFHMHTVIECVVF